MCSAHSPREGPGTSRRRPQLKHFVTPLAGATRILSVCLPLAVFAQTPAPRDLTQISVEDLMNVQVTSVSRKEQPLSETGAAIFVISQDDIQRSGATNIPDILRMVPGVNVARVDANAWAISIRGFNSLYSDKILVLIDGRTLYTPAFSGVLWDGIDVPLEDIERIEVIRGPGGTVWGANAVNGVISIITLSSQATQGGVVAAEGGTEGSGGLTQYGGRAGAGATWRVFGKYSNTDSSVNQTGEKAADGWHAFHEGFRFDWQPSARDKVLVQGDLYKTGEGETLTEVLQNHLPSVATFNDPVTVGSGDMQVRWSHELRNGSNTSLNVDYSHTNRYDQGMVENLNSLDLDFQHHVRINSWNDVVWGLAYRLTNETITSGYSTVWVPSRRIEHLYTTFVQDEIKLARSVHLTIGTKLEHNAYTGFEYEPSAQFVWTPTSRQTIWLSASQAVRQPARQDTDLQFDASIVPATGGTPFGVVTVISDKDIRAEELLDYEAGYRSQVTKRFSVALAMFRSYYRQLQTTTPGTPFLVDAPGPPHFVIPLDLGDDGHARTYGGETFATWNVTNRWQLSPSYSLIHMNMITNPVSQSSVAGAVPGDTPKHQIQLRSTLGLRSNVDWDTSLYFVGQLPAYQIPAYTRLDVQLRWRIVDPLELSIVGQNLLSPRHAEFGDASGVDYTDVLRSVSAKIIWKF